MEDVSSSDSSDATLKQYSAKLRGSNEARASKKVVNPL
jgi:hypothetical protein